MARRFDIHINAKDNASSVFRRAGQLMAGYFAFHSVKAGIQEVVTEAAAFEHQMASVSTMIKTNAAPLTKEFSAAIQQMAGQFGQSKEVLSKGLFDILSAGVDAAAGLDVLTLSAKAAIAGSTDTATAVDGATTVLNAFKLEAAEATRVFDLMFNTVREGKITFEELSENIAKLAPLADAAGLSVEEMFASIATAVKVEKPDRAMTAIAAALTTATKQGKQLKTVLHELRGADLEEIFSAGFDKRAAQGIALLSGNYEELQKQIKLTASASGLMDEAYQKMAKTAQTSLNKTKEHFKSAMTDIGSAITGSGVLDVIHDISKGISELTTQLRETKSSGNFLIDMARAGDIILRGVDMQAEQPKLATAPAKIDIDRPPGAPAPSQADIDAGKKHFHDRMRQLKREEEATRSVQAGRAAGRKQYQDFLNKERAGFDAQTKALKDQLRIQSLINAGKEKQAFVEAQLLGIKNKQFLTEAQLAEFTKTAGKLFEARRDKEEPAAFRQPTGPQQAFVTRGLSGLGTTQRPIEQTAKHTKTTAEATTQTNDKLDTLITATKQNSKRTVVLYDSNLP